jgi:hypothetical protein
MYFPCCCEEFESEEVAPDEQQRCSLVEWVGLEGKRRMINDEKMAKANKDIRHCGSYATPDSDEEWSFVDEYCGVQSCSSETTDNGDE